MTCVPTESAAPLGPSQLELAEDVSMASQEPSLCFVKLSATVLVTAGTPSSW